MCSPLFCFLAASAVKTKTLQDLVPQPGTEVVAPTVEAQSLNHRTSREVPVPHYSKTRKVYGVIN